MNIKSCTLPVKAWKTLFIFLFLSHTPGSFSQDSTEIRLPANFGGAVTVTTKGISIIPNLTLGKPAAIFDLSMGRKLRFEPQFRFSLEGKPWSFIFWWRYEILNTSRFQFKIGAHPAFAFSEYTDSLANGTKKIIRTQQYLAGEFSPIFFLARNISISPYYLYAHGFEKGAIRNTHYLALRGNFSNIRLSDKFYLRFNPQFYYLRMDINDGFYFNATLALVMKNLPLSVSALINQTIETEIPFGEDFLWNISLTYTFSKKYRAI